MSDYPPRKVDGFDDSRVAKHAGSGAAAALTSGGGGNPLLMRLHGPSLGNREMACQKVTVGFDQMLCVEQFDSTSCVLTSPC